MIHNPQSDLLYYFLRYAEPTMKSLPNSIIMFDFEMTSNCSKPTPLTKMSINL
jgi:hypothetical protein